MSKTIKEPVARAEDKYVQNPSGCTITCDADHSTSQTTNNGAELGPEHNVRVKPKPLTKSERKLLKKYMKAISDYNEALSNLLYGDPAEEIGLILLKISDRELYREDYPDFSSFLNDLELDETPPNYLMNKGLTALADR